MLANTGTILSESFQKMNIPLTSDKNEINLFNYLVNMLEDMKKDIADLKTRMELHAYTLKELATGLGYSVQTMRNNPWRMPNYGKPDVGAHPGKWFYNTIVEWYAVPEDERRFKWESMSSLERRRFIKNGDKVAV